MVVALAASLGPAPVNADHPGRDAINRTQLGQDLDRLRAAAQERVLTGDEQRHLANAERVSWYLDTAAELVDPRDGDHLDVVLYVYEPAAFGGDGRVAIVVGDLDGAEHVAVTVPGFMSQVATMTPERSTAIYDEARRHSADEVAVIDWMGYDSPSMDDSPEPTAVLDVGAARAGAAVLATDIADLRADHDGPPVHLTVIGNSYGSTTVAIAADQRDLAADDVVLTGSPGAGAADDADDLVTGRDHTWVGSASGDPITRLGTTGWTDPTTVAAMAVPGVAVLGNDPAEDTFGAIRFTAEPDGSDGDLDLDDHGQYYDPGGESLRNIGAIVTDRPNAVVRAEHRHDPLLEIEWDGWGTEVHTGVQDPEADRTN